MKFYFKNADGLMAGINLVSEELGIEISSEALADIQVTVLEKEESIVKVSLNNCQAEIIYGGGKSKFFRALAILSGWIKEGEKEKSVTQTPRLETNGTFVDMSRNAVMNVKTIKYMLRKIALMGMNTYLLYTEDTYEIENRPYFGYMRGRYTKAELRELDAYAAELGIELIPCIQLLGHLATHLRWPATSPYKDTANILLVGADETYRLIEDMLKTVSECFTSRRIFIGMDETKDLGLGNYVRRFGYREGSSLFFEHMNRVCEMVQSYGLKPSMFSDMFFSFAAKGMEGYADYDLRVQLDESISKHVPEGMQLVFWDYYREEKEFYVQTLEKHIQYLDKNVMFFGGVWLWSGFAPQFSRSLRKTLPALEACREKNIKEVVASVWLNGSEACQIMSLAGLAWYAEFDYHDTFEIDDVRKCLKYTCGISYDDIVACELVEYPHDNNVGISKALLYNDPLTGLVDKHIDGFNIAEYYKKLTPELENKKMQAGALQSGYNVLAKLSDVLENKGDFGVRLKKAYDAKDTQTLEAMAGECDVVVAKLKNLRDSHFEAWIEYNKPFGWEVHDIRYGGLVARFETAKKRILSYLSGECERIEELEEMRLRIDGRDQDDEEKFGGEFLWYGYNYLSTANIL